ncbi:hypothetical protein [Aeromonas rivipollensis]
MKIFQAPPAGHSPGRPLMLSTATDNRRAQALGEQRDIDFYN